MTGLQAIATRGSTGNAHALQRHALDLEPFVQELRGVLQEGVVGRSLGHYRVDRECHRPTTTAIRDEARCANQIAPRSAMPFRGPWRQASASPALVLHWQSHSQSSRDRGKPRDQADPQRHALLARSRPALPLSVPGQSIHASIFRPARTSEPHKTTTSHVCERIEHHLRLPGARDPHRSRWR